MDHVSICGAEAIEIDMQGPALTSSGLVVEFALSGEWLVDAGTRTSVVKRSDIVNILDIGQRTINERNCIPT